MKHNAQTFDHDILSPKSPVRPRLELQHVTVIGASEASRPGSSRSPLLRVFDSANALWLLALVVALGTALRVYRFQALSLWLDEGITVYWSRQPWPITLGIHGYGSTHPPLYYVLVKLASYVVPDVAAGRVVSVLAGSATIPVLYALANRLTRQRVALVASLFLAIAPVHIWYSQEARMYTLMVLFVALSYLALLAYYQQSQPLWAIAYGFFLLIAMYSDYSAIYSLVPQVPLLLGMFWSRRNHLLVLVAAATLAGIGYLPWIVRLLSTVQTMGDTREGYLGVTPVRFFASLRSLGGLDGSQEYFASQNPTPWDRWPDWQIPMLLAFVLLIALGCMFLARRSTIALSVAGALGGGTLAVAVLITLLVSPGYAERTILATTLGLALFVGAATDDLVSRWYSVFGSVGVIAIVLVSTLTLQTMYFGAYKQEWNRLADEAAIFHDRGIPLVSYPTLATTFLGLYQPQVIRDNYSALDDGQLDPNQDLDSIFSPIATAPVVVVAYMDVVGVEVLHDQLAARGYEQLLKRYIVDPLFVELWALPTAQLNAGENLLPPPAASTAPGEPDTWQLPPQSSVLGNNATFRLEPDGTQVDVTLTTPRVIPGRPYLVQFTCRNALTDGEQRVYASAHNENGAWIQIFPSGSGYVCPPGEVWQTGRFVFIAPPGMSLLTLRLRATGTGTADFLLVELRELK